MKKCVCGWRMRMRDSMTETTHTNTHTQRDEVTHTHISVRQDSAGFIPVKGVDRAPLSLHLSVVGVNTIPDQGVTTVHTHTHTHTPHLPDQGVITVLDIHTKHTLNNASLTHK